MVAGVAFALAADAGSSPGADRVRLTVSGAGKLVDAPLGLRVEGLAPQERVIVRVDARDAKGKRWRSQATFAADGRGVVDPARRAPLRGSYHGVEGDGLLWSMRPVEPPQDEVAFLVPHRGITLEIAVSAGGRHVAGAAVRRLVQGRGVERRSLLLATAGVVGRYYAPAPQRTKRPGVLLLGGSEGGIGGELVASLLASHGYPALSVAYFGLPGLPQGSPRFRSSTSSVRSAGSRDGPAWTGAGSSSSAPPAEARPPSCSPCTSRRSSTA